MGRVGVDEDAVAGVAGDRVVGGRDEPAAAADFDTGGVAADRVVTERGRAEDVDSVAEMPLTEAWLMVAEAADSMRMPVVPPLIDAPLIMALA